MYDHEMRAECRTRFEKIDERLRDGDGVLKEHREQLVETKVTQTELSTKMDTLTQSMQGLTKGIWGLVSAIGLTLFGFFIWYVQNIKR